MTVLGALYHWSPSGRRATIRREGLRPYCQPTISMGDVTFPYFCFGPTPSSAWGLSGDMHWVSEVEELDLWQVRLAEGDDVRVLAEFGPTIREVRTYGPIPALCCLRAAQPLWRL